MHRGVDRRHSAETGLARDEMTQVLETVQRIPAGIDPCLVVPVQAHIGTVARSRILRRIGPAAECRSGPSDADVESLFIEHPETLGCRCGDARENPADSHGLDHPTVDIRKTIPADSRTDEQAQMNHAGDRDAGDTAPLEISASGDAAMCQKKTVRITVHAAECHAQRELGPAAGVVLGMKAFLLRRGGLVVGPAPPRG